MDRFRIEHSARLRGLSFPGSSQRGFQGGQRILELRGPGLIRERALADWPPTQRASCARPSAAAVPPAASRTSATSARRPTLHTAPLLCDRQGKKRPIWGRRPSTRWLSDVRQSVSGGGKRVQEVEDGSG
jgi:hypothetical protein